MSGDERASDGDRQHAIDRLARGLAEGRLDLQEYEQRVDVALHARTAYELSPLTADLQSVRPTLRRS